MENLSVFDKLKLTLAGIVMGAILMIDLHGLFR